MNIRSVPEQVLRFNHPTSILIGFKQPYQKRNSSQGNCVKKNKGQMKFVEPQDMVNM